MARILCIGSVTKDMFFPTGEGAILETPEDLSAQRKIAFELGAKYHITERYEALGGCSVNVAAGLSRLNEHVACLVGIGMDDTGEWIKKAMVHNGIDTKHLVAMDDVVSDLSVILVDTRSGERTIFSNHGASQKLVVGKGMTRKYDWVFIGDLSGAWEKNIATILEDAQSNNVKIAYNPRQQMLHDNVSAVIESLAHCDVLFVNKDEAIEIVSGSEPYRHVSNMENESELLQALHGMGAQIVVLTDGVRGGWAFDGSDVHHVPAQLREAVDTTGAGDAFASGFLGAIVKGELIPEALVWGIKNSSSSVMHYGGQEGLLTEHAIVQ